MSFIIKDSNFNNNNGNLAFMDSSSIYISDCKFDSEMDQDLIAFRDLEVPDYFDAETGEFIFKIVEVDKADYIDPDFEQTWSSDNVGNNKVLYSLNS